MLNIQEVRSLLEIETRDTINKYLKVTGLSEVEQFDWRQFRRLLELQIFLGLRPGCYSKEMFNNYDQATLYEMFAQRGISIEQRLLNLQQKYQDKKSQVSLTLVLNND